MPTLAWNGPWGFLNVVERLDHDQWTAIMPTGFGGMLAVRTRLIPKRLARWLLESYDSWETSLKLPNGKVLIYEEDVHATLGLPVGPFEVREAKTLDNDTEYATFLEHWRQRPPVGSMEYGIIQRGGHGAKFIVDFIIYAISTCIIANANGTCHFHVLNILRNVNDIRKYNWCAYVIKCLNDASGRQTRRNSSQAIIVLDGKAHSTPYCCTQRLKILFTMRKPSNNIYNVLCFQLFYLDRVEFRAEKVETWFPTALNWATEREAEASDLGTTSTLEVCISKDQDKHTIAPQVQEEHQTTQMPHQGCHPPTTDMACLNENHTGCLATDDTFYYSA
ncbi:LOW QUALITY PROTEIN: hypothetical protein Cgig2_022629 [Carnegiea gigantea]|uniref:Aminotransferase-like plant mobile domain-containing protein n=1 Tax=Carnegiea gigantea TaxID=171969 RepID=A0A9Q1JY37_9CARY|nr:LOW QUALITY PROTEIN: hypothetical protein Cgig2_022629 [Carnegiea gigantea]